MSSHNRSVYYYFQLQKYHFIYQRKFNFLLLTANAKRFIDGITGQSIVLFTSMAQVQNLGPPPLNLKKILDMAPITVTDQTPMETVVDMFRKLGLRQTLVTHNGYVHTLKSKFKFDSISSVQLQSYLINYSF